MLHHAVGRIVAQGTPACTCTSYTRTTPPYKALASTSLNFFDFTASAAFILALCHDDFARFNMLPRYPLTRHRAYQPLERSYPTTGTARYTGGCARPEVAVGPVTSAGGQKYGDDVMSIDSRDHFFRYELLRHCPNSHTTSCPPENRPPPAGALSSCPARCGRLS